MVSALSEDLIRLMNSDEMTFTPSNDGKVLRGPEALKAMVDHLACGKVTECPFPDKVIQRAKGLHDAWCHEFGVYSSRGEVDDLQQAVDVRRLQMFLRAFGDPDEAALDTYARGVKVGADVQLPRTPAIYLEKQKW